MSETAEILDRLFETIAGRKSADPDSSYTAKLYAKGTSKIAQKVGEEGVELALAAVQNNRDEVISESADLFYHMFVLWADAGVEPSEIYAKLAEREGLSGLVEKASRKT
ncbi:phosphoribosyl-ATP diphosphatase [Sneathiella sp. P13V-1]|uniref:phosphoribosyl-ATP diphosphatase n=1 Tax=Sneathiella sp. P13V-1 TaxID=2697366 RepID=UPI00187B9EFA|nr:phosphoribosyl-ATP diphosphatase [Sneathiella sp. P13V-1]MBE7635807.1 phosphoribosyl-ATP diphosphatase [Sneathiella sp. P13V-1]